MFNKFSQSGKFSQNGMYKEYFPFLTFLKVVSLVRSIRSKYRSI